MSALRLLGHTRGLVTSIERGLFGHTTTSTITPNHPPCSLSRCMDPKGPRMERLVRVRWGVGSGTHNPLAGMPREAVDSASRIRPWNTPQRDRITRRNLVDRFPSPGGGSNLIGAHCARSRSMPAVGAGGSDQRQQGGNEHASLGEGKAELVVQGVRGLPHASARVQRVRFYARSKIGYLPKNCLI